MEKKHYSRILMSRISAETEKIHMAKDVIFSFRRHLQSSKFHNDTTIQVSDVQRWLDDISYELNKESNE